MESGHHLVNASSGTAGGHRQLLQGANAPNFDAHLVYDTLNAGRTPEELDYLQRKLMPAAIRSLGRYLRVRDRKSVLDYGQMRSCERTGPIDLSGSPPNADILVEVVVYPAESELCQSGSGRVIAGATACTMDAETLRPVHAQIVWCRLTPSTYVVDLETAIHEMMHALGFDINLMTKGYFQGLAKEEVLGAFQERGQMVQKIITPNVVHQARLHFACPNLNGAELEDDGGPGSAGSHWEQRIFEGELMDAQSGTYDAHVYRHAVTAVTLAVFQDSGWYDVQYANAGINQYGRGGGCAFAVGTYEEVLADPQASQFVCLPSGETDLDLQCTFEHTAIGLCMTAPPQGLDTHDGFARVLAVPFDDGTGAPIIGDCTKLLSDSAGGFVPGSRCLRDAQGVATCAQMTCTAPDQLQLLNSPYTCASGAGVDASDSTVAQCPDAAEVCGSGLGQGHLTCVGALNDCSGHGDCEAGVCFCHIGFGGADCSKEVCVDDASCPGGCPSSGFCGEVDPGLWSVGSDIYTGPTVPQADTVVQAQIAAQQAVAAAAAATTPPASDRPTAPVSGPRFVVYDDGAVTETGARGGQGVQTDSVTSSAVSCAGWRLPSRPAALVREAALALFMVALVYGLT